MTIDNYTDREREFQREIERLTAELELAKMKTYAASISPIAKERDELRAALAERDAKLAALEGQEPVAGLPKPGEEGNVMHELCRGYTPVAPSTADKLINDPLFFGRLHCYICKDDFDMQEFFWKDTNRRLGQLHPAAGAAPVPTEINWGPLKMWWASGNEQFEELAEIVEAMLAAAPKEPT